MSADNIPPQYRPLEGSERHPVPGARLLGPADAGEMLRVTIVLRHRPGGPPLPDPGNFAGNLPQDRPRLTAGEFAEKYGADPADITRVVAFAEAHRLRVVETYANQRTVIVSGTVEQMSKAFAVTLGRYEEMDQSGEKSPTVMYRGRDGFINIPVELTGVITGVFGLDNRPMAKSHDG
jgi:kumamolisin